MNKDTKAAVAAYDKARGQVNSRLVERHVEVDLLFACLIARVHPLLIGGAGVAKSMLVDEIVSHIAGDVDGQPVVKFTRLLAKATPPEEVLGPPNLAALMEGRWERVVTGKLPTAHVGFLDEIFKSNSTVLNSLLKIINERIFENDGGVIHCPLWMLVGASNELPGHERDDLRAFRDRFGICKMVEPVHTVPGRIAVLNGQLHRLGGDDETQEFALVTGEQIDLLQRAVAQVEVSAPLRDEIVALHKAAEEENLNVSARRLFEGVRVAMARTVMRGDSVLRAEDLTVMQHVLWTDPEDQGTAYDITMEYAGRVAKMVAKLRSEWAPLEQELNELKPKVPEDDAPEAEVIGGLASLNTRMRVLNARITRESDKLDKDGVLDDDHMSELAGLQDEVKTARGYIQNVALGFGKDDDE